MMKYVIEIIFEKVSKLIGYFHKIDIYMVDYTTIVVQCNWFHFNFIFSIETLMVFFVVFIRYYCKESKFTICFILFVLVFFFYIELINCELL